MHCMSRSAITVKAAATSPADLLGLSATRPGTCFHDASTLSTRIWLQYWLQPQGCGRRCPGSLRPSSVTRLTVKCFGGLRAAHCVGDMLPALKKWLGGGGVHLSVNGYEADVGSAGGGWRRVAAWRPWRCGLGGRCRWMARGGRRAGSLPNHSITSHCFHCTPKCLKRAACQPRARAPLLTRACGNSVK